jgi:hypothetical protein
MWLVLAAIAISGALGRCPNVPVVQGFQPAKYLGQWFEIGSSPLVKGTFERDCACTNARYGLYAPGNVSVTNKCSKGSASGPISTIQVTPRRCDALCSPSLAGIRHARGRRCVSLFFFSLLSFRRRAELTCVSAADAAKLTGERYA